MMKMVLPSGLKIIIGNPKRDYISVICGGEESEG